jgi:hypothetical protein
MEGIILISNYHYCVQDELIASARRDPIQWDLEAFSFFVQDELEFFCNLKMGDIFL